MVFRAICALLSGASLAFAAAPAAAQGSYSPYNETPSAALARYVRALVDDPKDFDALIGAGRSALELGDAQAAAGFFARADDVNPRSPLPQAGMGAVSVANGLPKAALPYFHRAQQLGASVASFACARGLAYDLLGQQAQAQSDYRLALTGRDREEASRRLALSLAISGNRAAALQILSPLTSSRDPGAARARAFVLALTGDSSGALAVINAAMPGKASSVAPFLQRLPTLQAGQKAAAVNLGIFPDSGATAYASVSPSVSSASQGADDNRLAGIDELLHADTPQRVKAVQPAYQSWAPQPAPTRVAYASVPRPVAHPRAVAVQQQPRKIWLQLASGHNAGALPDKFEGMKRHHDDLFEGLPAYVATDSDRARLVIGPFKDENDAEVVKRDLATANIAAFRWSNSENDRIVPIGDE